MASQAPGWMLVLLSCALLVLSGELAWIIILLPLAGLAAYVIAGHNQTQPTAGGENG